MALTCLHLIFAVFPTAPHWQENHFAPSVWYTFPIGVSNYAVLALVSGAPVKVGITFYGLNIAECTNADLAPVTLLWALKRWIDTS